ncbi:MAG: hypothetical protein DIU69_11890 [Bacillota bacterium]|nr:MAG: hypothetical protein DIU69_11890 [Bacillota bacterium]
MPEAFLEVKGLTKHYVVGGGWFRRPAARIRAVDGVDLTVSRPGETVGIAGESGSGKSTLARLILRLVEPTAGSVWMEGTAVTSLRGEALRRWRRNAQMVFQDPFWSLNPRQRLGDAVTEPLTAHERLGPRERWEVARELLRQVGLPEDFASRYPHELSGGQRQRVGIARALSVKPKLLILDEPTSALDVSVQAQILRLLEELQDRFGLTYLFISHDLRVLEYLCDRLVVMYRGVVVEEAPADELFDRPLHPYTRALLDARPERRRAARDRVVLAGGGSAPGEQAVGCRFQDRCPFVRSRCREEAPPLRAMGPGHAVACHFAGEF